MKCSSIVIIILHFATTTTVHAELPKFVRRTEDCPIPGNISQWNKASDRLGCYNKMESNLPEEQKHVYHCVPSSFLNETVEFCGRSVPIDGGFCPVYTYEFGPNVSPNYKNCSSFAKGCPKKFYYSKSVLHHRECLRIDKERQCYRSDPHCCLEDSCVTNERPKPDDENFSVAVMSLVMIVIVPFVVLVCVCLTVTSKNKKRKHHPQRKGEFSQLKPVKFYDCLFTIGEELKPANVTRLKEILEGIVQKKKEKELKKITNGRDLIKYMHGIFDFSMNFYILQGFMELLREEELVDQCRIFAERNCPDLTFYKREPSEGYKPVTIKLPKEHKSQIRQQRIESIRKNLMYLIDAELHDILFRGISDGCVLIHTEIRSLLLPRIKKLGRFSAFIFQQYEISDIYSEEKCLYSDTKVEQSQFTDNTMIIPRLQGNMDSLIRQITELPDLTVPTDFINIAVLGPANQRKPTFFEMCKDALKGKTTISTRAALISPSSNSTTPLIVISSKTRCGRPIKIRVLEFEKLRPPDTEVLDNNTLAMEVKTGRPNMSDLNQKIHCFVFSLSLSGNKSQFGYDENDFEKIKISMNDLDKPKYVFICSGHQYEDNLRHVFRSRVNACDRLGIPFRMILPDCDPESRDTRDMLALKSLSTAISHAIRYLNQNNQ